MKLRHFITVLIAALMLACTNQESLLKDYEKACEKGDYIKAAKLVNKMQEKYPNDADWTEEQQERLLEASIVLESKATEKAMEQLGVLGDALGNAFGNDDDDYDDEDDEDEDDDDDE